MKLSLNTLLLAACATLAAAAPEQASSLAKAELECGQMGVMKTTNMKLPENVAASDVRMCADHPHGRNRTLDESDGASLAPMSARVENPIEGEDVDVSPAPRSEETFAERSCDYSAPYGCSRGYCWKSCGDDGQWCWTAAKAGVGSWDGCSKWQDCGTNSVGYGCGRGCPFSCGCSC